MALVVLLTVVALLDITGGPTSESPGIIQSITDVPGEGGTQAQAASVLMMNGNLVHASVVRGGHFSPGQEVHVRIFRRMSSGTSSYEVVAPTSGNEMRAEHRR